MKKICQYPYKQSEKYELANNAEIIFYNEPSFHSVVSSITAETDSVTSAPKTTS